MGKWEMGKKNDGVRATAGSAGRRGLFCFFPMSHFPIPISR
jgi:hypothetical protein